MGILASGLGWNSAGLRHVKKIIEIYFGTQTKPTPGRDKDEKAWEHPGPRPFGDGSLLSYLEGIS
jgi:hypothetical protein